MGRLKGEPIMNDYITIERSAFEEIVSLAQKGFTVEITESTDGEPIILAKKNGYIRTFMLGV